MNCCYCNRSTVFGKEWGITFHCFPTDEAVKNLWIKACALHMCFLDDLKPKSRLCSDHFIPNDFGENKRIRKGAVPTRFSYKPHVHCIACREIHDKDSRIKFYRFPEEANRRKMWQSACSKNGFNIVRVLPEHSICSNHFSTECFKIDGTERKTLKIDAVPSVFPCKSNSEVNEPELVDIKPFLGRPVEDPLVTKMFNTNSEIKNEPYLLETISTERTDETISQNQIISEESVQTGIGPQECSRCLGLADNSVRKSPERKTRKFKVWRPARVGDLTEDDFDTPQKAKKNFRLMSDKCKQYQGKLNNCRTQIWKLKKNVKTLESLLFQLFDQNLISQEAVKNLNESAGDTLRLLVEHR